MLKTLVHSRFIQFAFIASILVSISSIYMFEQQQLQKKLLSIQKKTAQYNTLISNTILHAASATYPIAALIQAQNGQSTGFKELATKMLPLYPAATALQLQPNGIIQQIVPLKGNEAAIGFDVKQDPGFSQKSLNEAKVTLTGPLTFTQGGKGFVARLPIYLNSEKGTRFWGFSAVLIRTEDLVKSAKLAELTQLGIAYQLNSKPSTKGNIQIIARSPQSIASDPIIFSSQTANKTLLLQLSPINGWRDNNLLIYEVLFATIFTFMVVLLSSLTTTREKNERQQTEFILDQTQLRLSEAQNYANLGYWEYLVKDGSAIWSKRMYEILGIADDQPAGIDIMSQIVSPDILDTLSESLDLNMSGEDNHYIIYPIKRTNDNEERWIESSGKPIRNSNGDVEKLTGFIRDITQAKHTELRRSINSNVLEQLLNDTGLYDILNSIIKAIEENNPSKICSILLLDLQGKHLLSTASLSLPDFYNQAINGIEIGDTVGSCGVAAYTQRRVIVEDIKTHPYWAPYKDLAAQASLASCWSQPIMGSNSTVLGTFAIYQNKPSKPTESEIQLIEFAAQVAAIAIERSRTNDQLKLSSRVFTHTQEGISITNANGIIIDVNPAFCNITGYSRDEIIGKNPSLVSSGRQSPEFYSNMWKQLSEQGYWKGEVWNKKKNGEIFAELLSISSLSDQHDKTINYVGIFSDITQSKNHQEELSKMAHYDPLTGLPNRALFADRFQQAIAHSKRYNKQLAVCFIDLDNFKPINDNFGHEAGDQLLISVAQRITACIREEDTISRQGGDEFTLLINDINTQEEAIQTLTRIHQALAKPYIIDDKYHLITASSGATLYPEDDADLDTLLRHADQAMYQAKLSGKNRYHLFNPREDKEAIYKHHRISEIDQALSNGEFILHYQPKVNMVSGQVFGAEALIRWYHPTKGVIPPLDFLPLIDGTELDIKIGSWVITEALSQINKWKKAGITLEVSVNISSHHLQSKNFFKQLADALQADSATDPHCLQLEILESSALSDLNAISNTIKMCQEHLGVKFALDDFGTGYSSLTHIRNLPVNTIKIDQTFVRNILSDPDDFRIIDGTIGLADAFNRNVIAEGVETTETGLMLQIMGCEQAQGYGISKPMPADEFPPWLTNYHANQQWVRYKNKKHSEQQNKAVLYGLISNHWHQQFTTLILKPETEAKVWPLMDVNRCHCGAWIQRAEQDMLFKPAWLKQLKTAHDAYHLIAQDLQLKYRQGMIDEARAGITRLTVEFGKTLALLELIIPDSSRN